MKWLNALVFSRLAMWLLMALCVWKERDLALVSEVRNGRRAIKII
jgi:hypothetical protein